MIHVTHFIIIAGEYVACDCCHFIVVAGKGDCYFIVVAGDCVACDFRLVQTLITASRDTAAVSLIMSVKERASQAHIITN